ncbi:protein gast1 [Phtheirospermum japonicum]|uniref:Protein gast1 n=1 Tax=Phtheirospermum japonicum TaxID=374723 RepID=A0A830CZ82_9LAMI|nr:protein gast1 [Phtheirospermum japonicum]
MASLRGAFNLKNVHQDAQIDAQRHHSRSHAWSSAKNVVQSVCVCHLAHMGTSKFALATTTGKPRKVDQNALEKMPIMISFCYRLDRLAVP